jgi:hypothetical protein
MRARESGMNVRVSVSPDWWDSVQSDLQDAVDGCNSITSAIAAHQIDGKYDAEDMLDQIEGQVRTIRKLIEAAITPI